MDRFSRIPAAVLCLAVVCLAATVLCLAAGARADEPPAQFRVHEWGVHIRSLARVNSDLSPFAPKPDGEKEPNGVLLPPRTMVDGLPGFVLRHDKEYTPKAQYRNWNKPVIHFYGAEGKDISVEVRTPQGRPIAYWPKPTLIEDTVWMMGSGMTDAVGMKWQGKLVAKPKDGQLPAAPEGHWWGALRQVPGLYLQTDGGT